MKKVSVIVPVYNTSKYLAQCLDSVISQTLEDMEIVCVNDGSTDTSADILLSYAQRDARIKVVTKENGGYGAAMNDGIRAATGEYVGIVESDDYVDADMFLRLYDTAKKHNADVVKSDFYTFNSQEKQQNYTHTATEEFCGKALFHPVDERVLLFTMNTWTGIYRREFLLENKIFHSETPGASFQDTAFWFKTVTLANPIVFLKEAYYHYRQDNPDSSINNKEKVNCISYEYKLIEDFLHSANLFQRYSTVYHVTKFRAYMFNYNRIAPQFKVEFLKKTSEEFDSFARSSMKYLCGSEVESLQLIVKDPAKFYRVDSITKCQTSYEVEEEVARFTMKLPEAATDSLAEALQNCKQQVAEISLSGNVDEIVQKYKNATALLNGAICVALQHCQENVLAKVHAYRHKLEKPSRLKQFKKSVKQVGLGKTLKRVFLRLRRG